MRVPLLLGSMSGACMNMPFSAHWKLPPAV
jgi:hypothetical protein